MDVKDEGFTIRIITMTTMTTMTTMNSMNARTEMNLHTNTTTTSTIPTPPTPTTSAPTRAWRGARPTLGAPKGKFPTGERVFPVDCVIRSTDNNTHVVLRWPAQVNLASSSTPSNASEGGDWKMLQWSSSTGKFGFHGSKRGTAYAAESLTRERVRVWTGFVRSQGTGASGGKVTYAWNVFLVGHGKGRTAVMKVLNQSKPWVTVGTVSDATPLAHNGCRPKKPRRV